jgi:hypothetical protein
MTHENHDAPKILDLPIGLEAKVQEASAAEGTPLDRAE